MDGHNFERFWTDSYITRTFLYRWPETGAARLWGRRRCRRRCRRRRRRRPTAAETRKRAIGRSRRQQQRQKLQIGATQKKLSNVGQEHFSAASTLRKKKNYAAIKTRWTVVFLSSRLEFFFQLRQFIGRTFLGARSSFKWTSNDIILRSSDFSSGQLWLRGGAMV